MAAHNRRALVLTVSDGVSAGTREDWSGAALATLALAQALLIAEPDRGVSTTFRRNAAALTGPRPGVGAARHGSQAAHRRTAGPGRRGR